jgi:hypothetical protein
MRFVCGTVDVGFKKQFFSLREKLNSKDGAKRFL